MFLEWKLKAIRRHTQKKLNKRNLSLYKDMISYMKNSTLRNIEREELLQQIMDMLLQAQQEGKPAEMIIGYDYEAFCQSIIDEVESSKSIIYKVLSFIQRYFVWVLTFVGITMVVNSIESGMINLEITISELYTASIIFFTFIPFIRKSKQKAVMAPVHSRLLFIQMNIRHDSTGIPLGLMIFIAISSKFLLKAIFGENIFSYSFYANQYLFYIIAVMVVIIAIEIYTRMAD